MRVDSRGGLGGPKLIPAPEPSRRADGTVQPDPIVAIPGGGTGRDLGTPNTSRVGRWITRWQRWRSGFEQKIGPNARRFWALYRMFDGGPMPGPGQEWRDRTVIPECYKIIETRLPRLVLPHFGGKMTAVVEGRDAKDESYEETVRILLEQSLDDIGRGDTLGSFIQRVVDGKRYGEIMGHVWFKVWWRTDKRWMKTRMPILGDGGDVAGWEPVEVLRTIYDNIDINWLGLGDLAVDLANGPRRWAIERVQTTLSALTRENEAYKKENGRPLYKNLHSLMNHFGSSPPTRESYEEPRDTEHWPLTEASLAGGFDDGEQEVELWLCWDNVEGTLTKIANRSIELDHGLSPTPDGLDPYLGVPAVPIPGRVYGDSILHWVGPLAQYQTRIARARADEVLLNIWQQFVYRAGSIQSTNLFWRPGGGLPIDQANTERPISDSIWIFPRRPVFQEAWQEEGYRQQQAESTAGADAVGAQGTEATSKSRDVSATEVQQRVMQGSSRYQLENLYMHACFVRPMLHKMFDLHRQNLTVPRSIRVLNKDVTVDLRDLDRTVDFKIGGGMHEQTVQEKRAQAEVLVNLSANPVFAPYLKPRPILMELLTSFGRKDTALFVKTDQEVMAPPMLAAPGGPGGATQPPAGGSQRSLPAPAPAAAGPQVPPAPGGAGAGTAAGVGGQSPQPAPSGSRQLLAEV